MVEALIGAVYVDKGFAAARTFVEWLMDDAARRRIAVWDVNYKVRAIAIAIPCLSNAGPTVITTSGR